MASTGIFTAHGVTHKGWCKTSKFVGRRRAHADHGHDAEYDHRPRRYFSTKCHLPVDEPDGFDFF
jgi:hypothetical protein